MTATKMNAQEIIQFIANAEKKTSVKVTFEGQLAGAIPASVIKLGNVLFGDWKDIAPLLDGLTETRTMLLNKTPAIQLYLSLINVISMLVSSQALSSVTKLRLVTTLLS